MARLTKNHDKLYFDSLCRTQKGETVLSLIHATYQAKRKSKKGNSTQEIKKEIAERLESAYNLYKKDSGTYTGDLKQFESQYTIGHELCIWENSELDLTPLALMVAENYITIRDYFDIIFLNYFQPVNKNIVHILYHLLEYMCKEGKKYISKDEMSQVYMYVGHTKESGNINGAWNMLLASNYFRKSNKANSLEYVGVTPMKELLSNCNTRYVEKGYESALKELGEESSYIKYLLEDHRVSNDDTSEPPLGLVESVASNERIEGGYNKIYYGTPGCGKSYLVENELLKNVEEKYKFRTIFYRDYTHTDFVGQLIPTVEKVTNNGDIDERVKYKFVPGSFTLALESAYSNPTKMVYLVIEEINRGDAASIFGDLFQLLDRKKECDLGNTSIGQSEYSINKVEISNYLEHEKGIALPHGKVFIPSNLTLIGTMNTNDQNVFTLDTAFKRRWKMYKLQNRVDKNHPYADKYVPGTEVTWEKFVDKINERIVDESVSALNAEDKQIGPYFMESMELEPVINRKDKEMQRSFAYKMLEYLWSNVAQFERENWFKGNPRSLDNLVNNFMNKGVDIFKGDFFNEKSDDIQMYSDDGGEE